MDFKLTKRMATIAVSLSVMGICTGVCGYVLLGMSSPPNNTASRKAAETTTSDIMRLASGPAGSVVNLRQPVQAIKPPQASTTNRTPVPTVAAPMQEVVAPKPGPLPTVPVPQQTKLQPNPQLLSNLEVVPTDSLRMSIMELATSIAALEVPVVAMSNQTSTIAGIAVKRFANLSDSLGVLSNRLETTGDRLAALDRRISNLQEAKGQTGHRPRH